MHYGWRKAALVTAVAMMVITCFLPGQDPARFNKMPDEPYPPRVKVETLPASEAPLEKQDLVIGIAIGKDARAYPVNFLIGPRNEIVNDELGSVPVAVTWCSVNRSPSVFDRSAAGRKLTFGVRGIQEATLIMWDVETRSYWSQLLGDALEGSLSGNKLSKIPSILTTWDVWKSLYPETTVYIDWDGPYYSDFSPGKIRDFARKSSGPVEPGDLVIGIEMGPIAKAYLIRELARNGPVNDHVGDVPVLALLNRDLTTARVFRRSIGGRTLTFSAKQDGILTDRETGSLWDPVSLQSISGILKGSRLEVQPASLSLWQGWSLYRPKSLLYPAE